MSHEDVDAFFAEIPVWMKTDIRREVQLSTVSRTEDGRKALEALGIDRGGGNLLAGLGLVSYTEALGRIRRFNLGKSYDKPEDCFLAFFDEMADRRYAAWRGNWVCDRSRPSA